MVKVRCYECSYEATAPHDGAVTGVIHTNSTSNLRGKILADSGAKRLSNLRFAVEEIEVEVPLLDFIRMAADWQRRSDDDEAVDGEGEY